MDLQIFQDLFEIGLHPIPLKWNTQTNDAEVYPEHRTDVQSGNGKHDLNDVKRWLSKIANANGIALKLHPPFFMFDFDLKNTDNKGVYQQWLQSIDKDVLSKCCIEKTRSGGYHVYCKFKGVSKKVGLASSKDGKEVIALYTGGLLSFCCPTPGYEMIHNEFIDIQELTQEEFDIMVAAAQNLNEASHDDSKYMPGEPVEYPDPYRSLSIQFDIACTDELWDALLNSINLYPVQGERNKKKKGDITFYLYKREGTAAFFSAKVRFDRKRLFIFSASYPMFPSFHSRVDERDTSWHITPTRLLYYLHGKDWVKTIEQIKELSEAFGICLTEVMPVASQPQTARPDRLKFPYDIFPQQVQDYILCQRMQHEYIAGGILGAVSAAIGNTAWLEAATGYMIRPILYMAIVAPPGASKTPALVKAFYPLEQYDKIFFAEYLEKMKDYKEDLKAYEQDRKANEKPDLPDLQQIIIKDSTIEMVVKILTTNNLGCCILADELVGFLNRMNQYKAGDEVQKWLEMWSGGTILLQRITREVNRVEDPFCTILGGIQPGVLANLSSDDNQHNGFYHRFLFLYPQPEPKMDWGDLFTQPSILSGYKYFFEHILSFRKQERVIYRLSTDANTLYKEWFDFKNTYYNRTASDNVKGIIAKYQDYCLRFALIIQIMDEFPGRNGIVERSCMEKAIRLTEYFLGNMHKALKILAPESPTDKLTDNWKTLIEKMPDEFTTTEWVTMAQTMKITQSAAKSFLNRSNTIFRRVARGEWEKMV